ncbi:MAG: YkgJ family cysteine cluster protein [Candidatus Aenigmatarchaeota archaeon]
MENFEIVIRPEEILRTLAMLGLSRNDPTIFSRSKYAIQACKNVAKIYGKDKLIKLQYTGVFFLPILLLNRNEFFYFNCIKDGDCCLKRKVSVLPEEFEKICSFIGLDKKQAFNYFEVFDNLLTLKQKPDGKCVFLKNSNLCRIYPVRPWVCRKYPLLNVDKKYVEIELCPGCFDGEKVKAEDWIKENRVEEFSKKVQDYEDSFISYSSNLQKYGLFEPDLKQIVLKLYNII